MAAGAAPAAAAAAAVAAGAAVGDQQKWTAVHLMLRGTFGAGVAALTKRPPVAAVRAAILALLGRSPATDISAGAVNTFVGAAFRGTWAADMQPKATAFLDRLRASARHRDRLEEIEALPEELAVNDRATYRDGREVTVITIDTTVDPPAVLIRFEDGSPDRDTELGLLTRIVAPDAGAGAANTEAETAAAVVLMRTQIDNLTRQVSAGRDELARLQTTGTGGARGHAAAEVLLRRIRGAGLQGVPDLATQRSHEQNRRVEVPGAVPAEVPAGAGGAVPAGAPAGAGGAGGAGGADAEAEDPAALATFQTNLRAAVVGGADDADLRAVLRTAPASILGAAERGDTMNELISRAAQNPRAGAGVVSTLPPLRSVSADEPLLVQLFVYDQSRRRGDQQAEHQARSLAVDEHTGTLRAGAPTRLPTITSAAQWAAAALLLEEHAVSVGRMRPADIPGHHRYMGYIASLFAEHTTVRVLKFDESFRYGIFDSTISSWEDQAMNLLASTIVLPALQDFKVSAARGGGGGGGGGGEKRRQPGGDKQKKQKKARTHVNTFLEKDPASGKDICRLAQFGSCRKASCDRAHVCGMCGDKGHLAPKCAKWTDDE